MRIAKTDRGALVYFKRSEIRRLKNKLYVVRQLGVRYKIFEELEELLR